MFTRYGRSVFAGLLLVSGCVDPNIEDEPVDESTTQHSLTLQERITACTNDPRVIAKTTTVDICVGADLFLRETFNGNGRSCATCHPVANNFTIDPAFIATLPANDPLFVAEFNPTLAKLEIPAQMRSKSLILENLDGLDAPTTKFVLRSVPHNFSMGVSVTRPDGLEPVERTGWSGDGAPNGGSLRQFQQGAIMGEAGDVAPVGVDEGLEGGQLHTHGTPHLPVV